MISISNEVLHLKAYTNLSYKYVGPAANQNTNYKKIANNQLTNVKNLFRFIQKICWGKNYKKEIAHHQTTN